MQTFHLLAVAFLLVTTVAAISDKDTIFAFTYMPEANNNSALQIDPKTGAFLAKQFFGDKVFHYTGSALDPVKRLVYMVGDYQFDVLHADAPFTLLKSIPFGGNLPTDIQFDYVRQKLYGVLQLEQNQIVQFDLQSGNANVIASFPDDYGVIVGTPCFDIVNQRYFVTVSPAAEQNSNYQIMQVNMITKKVEQYIATPDVFDHMEYDYKMDKLLGVLNHTLQAIDVSTQKMTPLHVLPPGITELYASALDMKNQIYYVSMTFFGESRYGWVDINKNVSGFIKNYNDLSFMHFVPKGA